jgi:ubiquinone/menaquinone biosynthesis C-methylase UbiE
MIPDKYFKTRLSYSKKRNFIWKTLCNYLQKYIPLNSHVLDLGAGYCNFINNVNAKYKYAIDISKDFKEYANDNVTTVVTECNNLKIFKNESLDVVFASNILEHMSKDKMYETLDEVRRILKDGGKFIILQPNFKYSYKEYFDDYTHKEIYTDVSMVDILTVHDFSVQKSIPKFIPFSMKSSIGFFHFLLPFYLISPIRPFAGQMLIVAMKK